VAVEAGGRRSGVASGLGVRRGRGHSGVRKTSTVGSREGVVGRGGVVGRRRRVEEVMEALMQKEMALFARQ
jgi:hypothetical protein